MTHEPCAVREYLARQAAEPPLLYQVWESCLLSEIGAGVLVLPLLCEFLRDCLGSRRILLALVTDILLACLRILLPVHAHIFRGSV